MATTQVRGATQVKDNSVTFEKLAENIQETLTRGWTRVDFEATAGQTLITVGAGFSATSICEVYRNGILLHESEYTQGTGTITLGVAMGGGELVTVFWDRPIAIEMFTGEIFDLGAAQ